LFLENKKYEEIAEITGITQNYVRVKMNRIKKKLKKFMETED
jgi:RNA polymerase sigma-70 factor (ECF subfamily)